MLWLELRLGLRPGLELGLGLELRLGPSVGRDIIPKIIFLTNDFWVVVVKEVCYIDGDSNLGAAYCRVFSLLLSGRFVICNAAMPRA